MRVVVVESTERVIQVPVVVTTTVLREVELPLAELLLTPRPIRTADELRTLVAMGVKDFYIVHDYRPYGINGKIQVDHVIATGQVGYHVASMPKDLWLPIIYNPEEKWSHRDFMSLSDRNVEYGGYNNHNLFASKYAAMAYERRLNNGGSHWPQAPKKNW